MTPTLTSSAPSDLSFTNPLQAHCSPWNVSRRTGSHQTTTSSLSRVISYEDSMNANHSISSGSELGSSPTARRMSISWLDQVRPGAARRTSTIGDSRPKPSSPHCHADPVTPSHLRPNALPFPRESSGNKGSSLHGTARSDSEDHCDSISKPGISSGSTALRALATRIDSPQLVLHNEIAARVAFDSMRLPYQVAKATNLSDSPAVSTFASRPLNNQAGSSAQFLSTQAMVHHSSTEGYDEIRSSLEDRRQNAEELMPAINKSSEAEISRLYHSRQPSYGMTDFRMLADRNLYYETSPRSAVVNQRSTRARSYYAVVEFKLFRAEIYQIDTAWDVEEGVSLVIVEADRGFDLGKVYQLTSDLETAGISKRELHWRHWDSLLRHYPDAPAADSAAYYQAFEDYYNGQAMPAHTSGPSGGMTPKAVIGKPTPEMLQQLQLKEGLEEKAKRDAQRKAVALGHNMDILAAEYQFDQNKLTFYYWSPIYIHYHGLASEIYKMYKCRLWFCALNPKAFTEPRTKRIDSPPCARRTLASSVYNGQAPTEAPVTYFSSGTINTASPRELSRGNNMIIRNTRAANQHQPHDDDLFSRGSMAPFFVPSSDRSYGM